MKYILTYEVKGVRHNHTFPSGNPKKYFSGKEVIKDGLRSIRNEKLPSCECERKRGERFIKTRKVGIKYITTVDICHKRMTACFDIVNSS